MASRQKSGLDDPDGQPIRGLIFGRKWLEFISQSQIKGDYTTLPSNDLTLVSQNTFLLPLTGVRINLREQRFIIYIYLMPDDACGSKTLRENFH